MEYIAGLSVIYFLHALERVAFYRGKFLLLLGLGIVGAIAVFRGDVGTDTAAYEEIVRSYMDGSPLVDLEPGFKALTYLLVVFSTNDVLVVRLISLLIFFIFFVFAIGSDHDERSALVLYWIPSFFYLYSMNVLRAGLASGIFLLVLQAYRRNCLILAVVLSILAVSFHYSIAVALLLLVVVALPWRLPSLLAITLFVFGALAALMFVNPEYVGSKISLYSDFAAPSQFSGMSKTVAVGISLVGTYVGSLKWRDRVKVLVIVFFALVAFLLISNFSYAGLRLLDVLAFATPALVLVKMGQTGVMYSRKELACLAAAGVISACAVYFGFIGTEGEGDTPFLPYKFVF